jgi:hypothetical protein
MDFNMDVYDFRNDEDPVDMTHTELAGTRIAHFVTGFLCGVVVTFTVMAIIGAYLG